MNVLVMGGSGFIGVPLLRVLMGRAHTVALFRRGRTPAVLPDGILQITGDRNYLAENLGEFQSFDPDVVIDLITSSERQAKQLTQAFPDCRIILISSMDVYRAFGVLHGIEPGPPSPLPLTEESSLRQNLHPYPPERLKTMRAVFSWIDDEYDKIPAERVVLDHHPARGTVLRLPMIYGPGDPLHRFYGIVKRIQDGRDKIIFSQPMAEWRSPRGYVDNVAEAIVLAAEFDRAVGRIYNVAEPQAFSELEWARKIAAHMGWPGEFVVLPLERAPRHLLPPGNTAQHLDASSQRIREELDYRETVSLDEAISRTVAWETANPPSGVSFHQFDYPAEDAAVAA